MRRLLLNRRVLLSAAVIAGLLTIALWPRSTVVDAVTVSRGPLQVTIDEEGVTRVRERYVVSALVAGRVLRIDLEPGDQVSRGQVVARVRAEAPPLLDERARAEAQAAADAAQAAIGRARAEEQRARASLAQMQRDLTRLRELARGGVVAAQELETREAEAAVAEQSVSAAVYAVQAATSDLRRARARLTPTTADAIGRVITLVAPVDGVVLKRIRESEAIVPAGEPLLEIGDPRQLEIVSDLLSTDAVRVRPGSHAILEHWGGDKNLEARVRRIEPSGFTKVSALGVEEQRVNVVLDVVDAPAATALGDGYRVEVRVVVWESDNVLQLPTSALFRDGEHWVVYQIVDGRARRTRVELGHQTGQEAEVKDGVAEGARVIVHPPDTLADGARVSPR